MQVNTINQLIIPASTWQFSKIRLYHIYSKHYIFEKYFVLSFSNSAFFPLRTVPTIVTAQIFCACQGSRARRERNVQHAGHTDWFCLLEVWEVWVIFCGKDVSFFNRWKIISIYLVSSLKTEEVCTCCYFYVWSIWPNISNKSQF